MDAHQEVVVVVVGDSGGWLLGWEFGRWSRRFRRANGWAFARLKIDGGVGEDGFRCDGDFRQGVLSAGVVIRFLEVAEVELSIVGAVIVSGFLAFFFDLFELAGVDVAVGVGMLVGAGFGGRWWNVVGGALYELHYLVQLVVAVTFEFLIQCGQNLISKESQLFVVNPFGDVAIVRWRKILLLKLNAEVVSETFPLHHQEFLCKEKNRNIIH